MPFVGESPTGPTPYSVFCVSNMYGGNTEGGDRSVEIGAIGLMFMIALTFGHKSV